MFLDDQLYQITKATQISCPNDFNQMINSLYQTCENKWKPEFDISRSGKEAKILLDRTFNAWDSFIKKLEKENYYLADMVKKYSYKYAFMANEKLKEAYEKLG